MGIFPSFFLGSLLSSGIKLAARPVVVPLVMISSGTFLYPLQGLIYFLYHPILWSYVLTVLIPELVVTCLVYVFVCSFLWPPQILLAIFFNGPTGIFTGLLTVFSQASVVSRKLTQWLILPTPTKMLFDAVMSREGCDDLVVIGRARRIIRPGYVTRCRIYIRKIPRRILSPYWLIRRLTLLILSFVPIVGPIIVAFISAPGRGKKAHARYFELKGMTPKEAKLFVKVRRGQYTGFGLVSNWLELVPLVGTVFHFSNTVAGALWAAEIEKSERQRMGMYRVAGRQKIRQMVTGYTY